MKILLADHERDVRLLFEQRFRKEIRNREMEFACAYSGEEVSNHLNQNNQEAVPIPSDINMPGMSDLELPRQIKYGHESRFK